jgi:propanediol dehydratase large subunit
MRSKRFQELEGRPVNQETFIEPWPEAGLIPMDSPLDPAPSLRIEAGEVVEMDGKSRGEFDLLDHFIVSHALNSEVAELAMETPSEQIARILVDINVSRAEVLELVSGCTPAKLVDIVRHMNVLQMLPRPRYAVSPKLRPLWAWRAMLPSTRWPS